jgi:DNA-binding transcriptional LysR family regulator
MSRRFRYKDIQLPQLRSFCVAATQGNFTEAAKVLGLSPPTVWEQVRGLERRLGATLLLRRGRFVELTDEGRILLDLVQPHVHGLDSLERLFEAQRASGLPRLTVASTPNMLANYLVSPVQEFTRAYPAVCVMLRPSVRLEDGLGLVERGQADVGVLAFRPEQLVKSSLEFEHLFDLRLLLLTATSHPLAKKKKIAPEDLVQYPLIMGQEGTPSRLAAESILSRHNLLDRARIVLESTHADVIRSYVAAGIGIALMFAVDSGPTMAGLHHRVFDPRMEGLPAGLIVRKSAHLSEPVREFCRIVRRALTAK